MKFKERFAKFKKEVLNQYDIFQGLGYKEFEYKDFMILFPSQLYYKSIWSGVTFDSRDLLVEYLFFHYKPNFYPRPGGYWRQREGERYREFSSIKLNFESLINQREEMKAKSPG